jgi:hypothetical protein
MDLNALTSGHFLIGEAITSLPKHDLTTRATNWLDRWCRVQQFSQQLWKRWSKEYLNQLQVRYKWAEEKGSKLMIGAVILIREENISPLNWKLGHVLRVVPRSDGVVRSAWIKTASGEFHRASRNLSILSFSNNK